MAEDTLTPDDSGPGDEPERQPPDWARGLDEPPDPGSNELDDDDLDDDGSGTDWPRFSTGDPGEDLPGAPVVPLHAGGDDLDDDLDDDDDGGGAHLPLDASNLQRFEFDDLVEWGEWLTARWQLQAHLPPCWPAHHALRAEVLALRRDWVGVESGKIALSLWLHGLELALGRIERWRGACSKTEHVPDRQPPTVKAWATATAAVLFEDDSPVARTRQEVALGVEVPLVRGPWAAGGS